MFLSSLTKKSLTVIKLYKISFTMFLILWACNSIFFFFFWFSVAPRHPEYVRPHPHPKSGYMETSSSGIPPKSGSTGYMFQSYFSPLWARLLSCIHLRVQQHVSQLFFVLSGLQASRQFQVQSVLWALRGKSVLQTAPPPKKSEH